MHCFKPVAWKQLESELRLGRERYPRIPLANDVQVTHKGVTDRLNQLHHIVPIAKVRRESFTAEFVLYILSICTLNGYKAYKLDHRSSCAEPVNFVEYFNRFVKNIQENAVYAQQPLPQTMDDVHVSRLLPFFTAGTNCHWTLHA